MAITEFDQETKTAVMTVDGFEHRGLITVRPRKVKDKLTIARLTDKYLFSDIDGESLENIQVSPRTQYEANSYAIAKTVIVHPPGIVDEILESEDPRDWSALVEIELDGKKTEVELSFFDSFLRDYSEWSDSLNAEAREKKSGRETTESGIESASLSASITDSRPTTHAG